MSKLEKLIKELCPDGVEHKRLEEVISYEQPTKYIVKSTQYNDDFSIPVLTAGASFVLGYTNEDLGIYEATKENPVIIFDDFTTSFHWVDFSFKVKSSAMKMLAAKDESIATLRYLYFVMKSILFEPSQHARHWIQIYSKFHVPIPPLSVQQEIVRILDKFTSLETELEAELEARRKQYEYYRDELLTFGDDVDRKPLGEILVRTKGTKITAHEMKQLHKEKGNVRIFAGGETFADVDFDDIPSKDIHFKTSIIVKSRGNIGFEYYGQAFSHKNEFWSYHSENSNVNIKFVYYYLVKNLSYFQHIANNMQMPQISIPITNKYQIPVPPIAEQERIVAILDRFDALVNDITKGLPAEIEARRKQYEYYRDKLLTFKEKIS